MVREAGILRTGLGNLPSICWPRAIHSPPGAARLPRLVWLRASHTGKQLVRSGLMERNTFDVHLEEAFLARPNIDNRIHINVIVHSTSIALLLIPEDLRNSRRRTLNSALKNTDINAERSTTYGHEAHSYTAKHELRPSSITVATIITLREHVR